MKKKITAGVLLILLLAGVCIQPAYANSAQRHWRGTDGTGAVVTGEDCPIVVDKELLTFDVQEFPEQYYPDTDSFLAYTGNVTAEYIFRPPTMRSRPRWFSRSAHLPIMVTSETMGQMEHCITTIQRSMGFPLTAKPLIARFAIP